MPNQIDGVNYDFADNVAENYDYSIFHVRHLAREYAKGNTDKGLKGFKHKGRWVIDLNDAASKLSVVGKVAESEHNGGSSNEESDSDVDWLEGL